MPGGGEGRRLCVDRPQGIPHLVDRPRALRCDQHRAQRHRWSDANRYRRKEGRPLLEWVPDPLTPDRRREALALFADDNARRLAIAAGELDAVTERLADLRPRVPTDTRQELIGYLRRLKAVTDTLHDLTELLGLGWATPPQPGRGQPRP